MSIKVKEEVKKFLQRKKNIGLGLGLVVVSFINLGLYFFHPITETSTLSEITLDLDIISKTKISQNKLYDDVLSFRPIYIYGL